MEKIGANANIKIIGVTGHVSSGKSTLLGALRNMGVSTLSIDTVIHNLYNTNKELVNKITALLGDDILTNHRLDRKLIAKRVFNDKELLYKLEALTCPYVIDTIRFVARDIKNLLVVEIPLLFELSLEGLFDTTVFVKTTPQLCKQRSSLEDFTKRNTRLLSSEEKEEKADITITNNGSIADFNATIHKWIKGIIT